MKNKDSDEKSENRQRAEHKGDRQAVQRRRLCPLGVSALPCFSIRFGVCLAAPRSGALV